MTPEAVHPLDLTKIDLGAPAAERDIHKGLERYFVESEAFKRVEQGAKTIILGNRGVGKSAIFQMMAKRGRDQGAHVIELAPEDYSYELLKSTLATEESGAWAKYGAYAAGWKYLIYVQVMKIVCSKTTRPKRGAMGDIHRYIRDNHYDPNMSKLSALVSYIKRLEGVKLGNLEGSLKTRALEKLYKLEEINHLLPKLNEVLGDKKVIVLVDELDKGWDSSEDAQSFVAGLFQACVQINLFSPNLRVYMSLRQELYDNIPALYDDAQKYRDLIETITWTESGLLSLMAKRIRNSIPRLESGDDTEVWSSIFSEALDYRRSKSFNYLVDRTLYRPREIIQFSTQVIESAVEDGSSPPLNYSTVTTAEKSYSEDRTEDIASEYRFQYPGLLGVLDAFRGRIYTFSRSDLEYLCLEIICGDVPTGESAQEWLAPLDPESLIEILWRVGFLRARAVGGIKGRRRSGSAYLGPYQVVSLSLSGIQTFQVHPMFRSYLGMREPKRNPPD
ncbi:P-loop ATPase, Sll1717 family [Amycolatopsis sp. cmx-4-61]|uniref:P-loop ATPase, Sll1717 family n=1 Tax=Amycolatopsis sp. cmx-4-61 TaxID=2790937 RepID=UPI00397B27E0